jgi:hypothetical protein
MHSQSDFLHASALRGGTLVVIGGDARDPALDRLARALELSEVVHCPTRKTNASASSFEATLQRPGISLVVWLSGLTRTSHGRKIRELCARFGLPWLPFRRIPHPNALLARLAAGHSTRDSRFNGGGK